MRVAGAAWLLVATSLVGGCGGGHGAATYGAHRGRVDCSARDITNLSAEPSYSANYLDRWKTADGCPVRLDVLMTRRGKEACGGERVADILMGWPLGQVHSGSRPYPYRIYVRDPEQAVVDEATSEA